MSQPPQMNYATPYPPAEKKTNGLGIASLVLGILAFLGGLIPFCGLIPTLLFGVIGGILGLVGLLAAMSDKRTSVTFPIVGIAVNILAVIVGLVVTFAFGAAAANAAQKANQQIQQQSTRPAPTTSP